MTTPAFRSDSLPGTLREVPLTRCDLIRPRERERMPRPEPRRGRRRSIKALADVLGFQPLGSELGRELPAVARALGSGRSGPYDLQVSRRRDRSTETGKYRRILSPSSVAVELRAARLAIQGAVGAYRQQRASVLRHAACSPRGRPIFVLCLPKSASTFFSFALAAATGRRPVPAVPAFGRREQEFDAFTTLALRDRAVVLQSHTRYSAATGYFLRQIGTPPVLLVRNVYDSLISLWDHMRDEDPEMPIALVDGRDLGRDEDQMLDFLVDIAAAWYVQFFAGWMRAAASELDLLLLDYTTVTANTSLAIESVCRHVGDPTPAAPMISRSIEEAREANPRFNQGTDGRGSRLGEERQARVERLAAFYPDVDFSPIGIAATGFRRR